MTKIEVESAVFRRRSTRECAGKTLPLGNCVRARDETEEIDVELRRAGAGVGSKSRYRGADPVERCTRHESDHDAGRHLPLFDWRGRVRRHASYHSAIGGEQLLGFLPRDPLFVHHDRELHALTSGLKKSGRLFLGETTHLHHYSPAPLYELVVRRAKIDHEISVGLAESDHRAGGNRVEHELGRGSRLHARRAGDHLGAYNGENRYIKLRDEISRWRRACDEPRACPKFPGALERGAHVWSGAGSGDADDKILFIDAVLVHRSRTVLHDVFGAFL